MTSDTLSTYSLVDTPGLATLTEENEATTRGALLSRAEETRRAAVGADAAIFLFDAVPRKDEVEFIGELGLAPLNVVGVLSRADSFGEGALGSHDPIAAAADYAAQLQKNLAERVDMVIPVSGLLAQTASTGVVTEAFAREVRELTAVPRAELLRAMMRPSVETTQLAAKSRKVIEKVGEYGVFRSPDSITGAVRLNDWLTASSGLEKLQEFIDSQLLPQAAHHRCSLVMSELEELAHRNPAEARKIRTAIQDIGADNRSLWLNLYRAYLSLEDSPATAEFVEEVRRLVGGASMAEKLGLDRYATGWQILDRVAERRAWLQTYAYGAIDPAEENVLGWLYLAYQRIEAYGDSLT